MTPTFTSFGESGKAMIQTLRSGAISEGMNCAQSQSVASKESAASPTGRKGGYGCERNAYRDTDAVIRATGFERGRKASHPVPLFCCQKARADIWPSVGGPGIATTTGSRTYISRRSVRQTKMRSAV